MTSTVSLQVRLSLTVSVEADGCREEVTLMRRGISFGTTQIGGSLPVIFLKTPKMDRDGMLLPRAGKAWQSKSR
jgi:hypothetical protein